MKRRFIIAFAVLFAVFSVGIGTSIFLHWRTVTQLERVVAGHQIEELRQILSLRVHLSQKDLQVSGTVFANQLDDIVGNVKALDESIQGCFDCHHEPDTKRELERVADLVESYKAQFSTFITAILNEEQRAGLQFEAAATAGQLNEAIDRIMLSTSPALTGRTRAALAGVDRSWRVLAITLLVTLIAAVLVTTILVKSVTHPVEKLLAGTSQISAGELGFQIQHEEKHELGALMDSFNQMSAALESDQQRIDGYVARLRRLIRAVFSLRTTPETDALRPRLTRAMEELVDAEIYGSVLSSDLENVCVLSLQRHGDTSPFHQSGLSAAKLAKARASGSSMSLVSHSVEEVPWPFAASDQPFEVRDFIIAWFEHDDELRGALLAINKTSGKWVEEDAEVLSALGQGVAEALDNIHLFQDLQRQLNQTRV